MAQAVSQDLDQDHETVSDEPKPRPRTQIRMGLEGKFESITVGQAVLYYKLLNGWWSSRDSLNKGVNFPNAPASR